jgi:hypothetical protein
MSLAHVSVWKIAVVLNTAAIAFIALDPTVQVAIVAGIALILGDVVLGIFSYLNYKATLDSNRLAAETKAVTQQMSINVDGNLKRLLDEKALAATEHTVTSDKLAHAEGRQQGSDEERARDKS